MCLDAAGSGTDSPDLARLGRGDSGEDRAHERPQVLHAVGSGTNDDYTKRQNRDLLLELNTAVHCDQNIITIRHASQELTVLDTRPTAADHSLDSMAEELQREIYR